MAYHTAADAALSYQPCRYGESRIDFRGPQKDLQNPYIAFVGGSETYGKFVETPYCDGVGQDVGKTAVNLGYINAGVDVFLKDTGALNICTNAETVVLEVLGAQNMSNRLYTVHPRRNDRFLRASTLLKTIYADVDFIEFNFTRHLLKKLEANDADKFELVRQELKNAWVARMKTLIQTLPNNVVLLWMSDHGPDDVEASARTEGDPLFVDRDMLEQLRPLVKDIVEVTACQDDIDQGYDQMLFSELEALSAREMLGPVVQAKTAKALSAALLSQA